MRHGGRKLLCHISSWQVNLNLHPSAPRDAAHTFLEQELVRLGAQYRNPAGALFHAQALVTALNPCLPAANQFPHGALGDTMELLASTGGGSILGHIVLNANYLVTWLQEGTSNTCGVLCHQVSNHPCA